MNGQNRVALDRFEGCQRYNSRGARRNALCCYESYLILNSITFKYSEEYRVRFSYRLTRQLGLIVLIIITYC